jgi:hypothetical protein
MIQKLSDIGVEIPEISHIGIVVEDLELAMERYSLLLGIGPWRTFHIIPPRLTETTYRGEQVEYAMRIALTEVTRSTIELIEPLGGDSSYQTQLNREGGGFHHFACFSFEKPYEAVSAFRDADIQVLQTGNFAGMEFWYFDTRNLLNGLIFEVAANVEAVPEPDGWYDPED